MLWMVSGLFCTDTLCTGWGRLWGGTCCTTGAIWDSNGCWMDDASWAIWFCRFWAVKRCTQPMTNHQVNHSTQPTWWIWWLSTKTEGSQDSLLVTAPDSWSKSCEFESQQKRIFFSRVNSVCWLFFGERSTPVLPQWHIKDPGHSAKSAGGRLHLNMHTPSTHQSQGELTKPLSGQTVRIYLETSSHTTRQGTLGHSRLSLLSHCGLILA